MNYDNEEKKTGVFFMVIGLATLVVTIIGSTFAFFSATANTTGDNITGGTNSDITSALSVTVTRLNPVVTNASSINLVPANIDGTLTSVNNAVKAKCEANGYTGCHMYKIVATSKQSVQHASILLSTLTTTATVKTNWHYAIYKGTDTSATSIVNTGNINLTQAVDMHQNASLTANSPVTYYLIIYLTNTDKAQDTAGSTNETGTYNGTVTMNAAGGKVSASFATS